MKLYTVFLTTLLSYTTITHTQQYDAIINLGGDCQVAYQLKLHGLRYYALPFDTWITPYTSLELLLKNSCKGFLEPSNFIEKVDQKDGKEYTYILDQRYGVRLIHNGATLEKFFANFPDFSQTIERRIQRLFDLVNCSTCPLFIRKTITKDQAIALKDLLSQLRRGRPFMLLALDSTDTEISNYQEFQLCYYYLRQPSPYSWKGDPEAWREIFINIGLSIPEQSRQQDQAETA